MTEAPPKAKALADGVEVWCEFGKLVPVEDLKPNPRNPNTHPQHQVELLAKNIRHFGWRHPITVSRRSGLIVSGHGRLMAAMHLGLKLVPVDFQDFATDDDEIAVLVADNRLAELASLDLNELERIAEGWRKDDFDTLLAGFDPVELAGLLRPEAGAADDGDGDEHGDLEKGDVTVAVGMYRFRVTQAEFGAWLDGLRGEAGFGKDAVLAAIRGRLGL
jgi:hypothetical protein